MKEIHSMCYDKEEPMDTDMLPIIPPHPEPMWISNAVLSDSESGIDDFEVSAKKLSTQTDSFLNHGNGHL